MQHGRAPLLLPLPVLAGAGTGKTATLAARVAALVMAGVDPHRLLLLTFSRRSAQSMAQRAGQRLHQALGLRVTQPAPVLPWAGTFHAIGARLLRDYAAQVGLPAHFSIIDRGDAQDLMALQRQALGLAATQARFPLAATCLAICSRTLNSQLPLAQVLALELARRQIPFVKFGRLKFLEAGHIKDVLALLRWGQNPRCMLAGGAGRGACLVHPAPAAPAWRQRRRAPARPGPAATPGCAAARA